ncbi:MAG: NFACT RNA binding domain-containing protein [Lachnospiraceae bacterium]|nr:NFACT RNA binding domain-containing protein [Lachnospiraceae bacterium]
MAFDGITIANIVAECRERMIGGRIYKIAQPEKDELLLTIKAGGKDQYRLLISADASLPLIYFTENNKTSPMTAPNFCMLLRKHLQNARIIDITQPALERVIRITVEHLNELGDVCRKYLVVEIMGKHSNIIFCDDKDMIIDSIKHISGMVSSVREVLPGRTYFIPETQDKRDPTLVMSLKETSPTQCPPERSEDSNGTAPTQCPSERSEGFYSLLREKSLPVYKAIYGSFMGISPIVAQEICYRAQVDADIPTNALTKEQAGRIFQVFSKVMESTKKGEFAPNIVYENGAPVEYASIPLTLYGDDMTKQFDSISKLLETYYAEKNTITRIRQKSVDLRRIVQTALERNVKKYDLQIKQMKDTEKKDQLKVYGELLNTYGYNVPEGSKSMEALNYYTNEMITIPLNPQLTPSENAKKYFDKYGKLKRTFEALSELTRETREEIEHLESVSTALDIALQEEDLVQIKEELTQSGYVRRKGNVKKQKITSKPFHYISSDGYHIYVGKNNFQNEELTFQFAVGNDWWFHAKGIPGSHVIVKTNGEELPDRTFEEAGRLAGYYSKGKGQEKVEIDYTEKKNVKKPSGGKPGFVVYYTNYSLMIDTDISGIEQIS